MARSVRTWLFVSLILLLWAGVATADADDFEEDGEEEDCSITLDAYAKEVQESKRLLRAILDDYDDELLDDCPVCMEKILPAASLVLGCGHRFCNACIGQIRTRDMHNACPMCRAPM